MCELDSNNLLFVQIVDVVYGALVPLIPGINSV